MTPDIVISSPPAGTPMGTGNGDDCQLLGGRVRVRHFCSDYPEGTVTEMAP